MTRLPAFVPVLIVLVLVSPVCAETLEPAPPERVAGEKLTKAQLLDIIQEQQSKVEDLSVSYMMDQGGDDPFNRIIKSAGVVKDYRYFSRQYCGGPGDGSEWKFMRENAYNGEVSTHYDRNGGSAIVSEEWSLGAEAAINMYLGFMLMRPPRYGREAVGCGSLPAYLESEYSTLHDEPELVDGKSCLVLEIGLGTQPAERVWLDTSRGYLPIRHVQYRRGKPRIKTLILEAVELIPGLWFPTRVARTIFDFSEAGTPRDQVFEVDGTSEGKPNIKVNSGVPDEFFDLWKRVPAGTKLYIQGEDGRRLIPVGPDLKPLGQE